MSGFSPVFGAFRGCSHVLTAYYDSITPAERGKFQETPRWHWGALGAAGGGAGCAGAIASLCRISCIFQSIFAGFPAWPGFPRPIRCPGNIPIYYNYIVYDGYIEHYTNVLYLLSIA